MGLGEESKGSGDCGGYWEVEEGEESGGSD